MIPLRLAHLAISAAVGGAVTLWWLSRRVPARSQLADASGEAARSDPRVRRHPAPEFLSDYGARRNGADESNARVDGAVEDTFPASDPPAFMQAVIAGPPAREEAFAIHDRQRRKRADEDAFAE
jgi:hypothetical protein